ncbi:MAG: CdaR family protein [Candidatus Limnocylindria bacterium]
MRWLVRNWHLKLGALGLATILYTGFVYSGSFTEQPFPGVSVQAINLPSSAYPLTQQLGTVDIRYRLSVDSPIRVTAESFSVTVDLSEYDMELAPETQALAIQVRPLAEGLDVLSFSPTSVPVAIDRVGQREVPVVVDRGEVPEGLSIGTPSVSARQALASGPESQLGRVTRAVARVQIFESGIDITGQQVTLVPVDVDGRQVESVELDPSTVTVSIAVSTVETSKTVPIRPRLTGSPADGFEVASVTVEPSVVTLFGMPADLAGVVEVPTEGLGLAGAAESLTLDAVLVLPEGTRLAEETADPVISVTLRPAEATRTLLLGVDCVGEAAGVACLPEQGQLAVILEGTVSALATLDPADLTPVLDVSGLPPGRHVLEPALVLPSGISLVSISPGSVAVVLQPPATPSPSPPPG